METSSTAGRYRVEAAQWQDEPVTVLYDDQSGSQATIAGGIGANCVAWQVRQGERAIAVLETPPAPQELRSRRFKAGIPILWPFPGRVRDARYTFDGRQYELPRTDKGGVHHIHGVAITAPWRSTGQGVDDSGAWAAFSLGPADLDAESRAGYPFDFNLTMRYTLHGRSLTLDLTVANQGQSDLPFGYGLHPYFHAPLIDSPTTPDRTHCLVLIPVGSRWPAEAGLPTGQPQPLKPDENFSSWRPLGPQPFDHMFGDVHCEGDVSVAGWRDPGAGLEVMLQADRAFREWVLFTQPNRPSLCIEPYTCPPNAINFAAEGLSNDGLIRLAPGASWSARVAIEVRDI